MLHMYFVYGYFTVAYRTQRTQDPTLRGAFRATQHKHAQTFQNQAASCVQAVIMKLRSDPTAPNPAQNGIPPKG